MNTTTPSAPSTPPKTDLELTEIIRDTMRAKGLECENEDIVFARGVVEHVRAFIGADPSASNPASRHLADTKSAFGMTAAIILGRMARQLRTIEDPREQMQCVSVAIVHVLATVTMKGMPKFDRPKGKRP